MPWHVRFTSDSVCTLGTAANRHDVPGTHAAQQRTTLFDHLVGAGEQRWRHVEAEHCRRLVDDKLELGRVHNRNIRRLGAFENISCIDGDLTIGVSAATSIVQRTKPLARTL